MLTLMTSILLNSDHVDDMDDMIEDNVVGHCVGISSRSARRAMRYPAFTPYSDASPTAASSSSSILI